MVSVDFSSSNATRIWLTHQTTIKRKKNRKKQKKRRWMQNKFPTELWLFSVFQPFVCVYTIGIMPQDLTAMNIWHTKHTHTHTRIWRHKASNKRKVDAVHHHLDSIRFHSIQLNRFTQCISCVVDCTTFSGCQFFYIFDTHVCHPDLSIFSWSDVIETQLSN